MNIEDALTVAKTSLKKAKVSSFLLDSQLLLAHAIGKNREFIIANPEYRLSTSETSKYKTYISRRTDREPVAYITNQIEFYGHSFYVDNRVLSPRIETEIIVENAIKYAPRDSRLIDIGTGSGAIAISIALDRPDLDITASEISADALDVAKLNAKKLLGQSNIQFIKSDLFKDITQKYETIVTNLPYVSKDYLSKMKPEVKKEPSVALYGGSGDGLDIYRDFYDQIGKHLVEGSRVYHESDPWQHEKLIALAKKAGLKKILEDYFILGFENTI